MRDVATDAAGNIYVTGGTASAAFPLSAGAYDTVPNGSMDVFVAKLAPDGTLIWSSLLGGPKYDRAYAIELAPNGDVVVAGRAGPGFPTTAGVVQATFGGDDNPNALYGQQDGFVAAFSPDGRQLRWATYLGGPDRSTIRDLDVDGDGAVVAVLGDVSRPNPHVTAGAFQTSLVGGSGTLVARLSATGTAVEWATYLDGSGVDGGTPSVRIGQDGTVYVLGYTNSADMPTTPGAFDRTYNGGGDLHLARLQADGRQLLYGTFIGGSDGEYSETHGLAVKPDGRAVIGATTLSSDFPVTAGVFQTTYGGTGGAGKGAGTNYLGDGFVAIVSADGASLLAATYVGSTHGEGVEGVVIRPDDTIALSGATYSPGFPITAEAAQARLRGQADVFVVVLSADLRHLVYGTFVGGNDLDYGRSLAGTAQGILVVGGQTRSANWPVAGALQGQLGGGFDGALAAVAR